MRSMFFKLTITHLQNIRLKILTYFEPLVFCCQGVNTKWEYWSKMGQLNPEQVSVCWVVYSKFPVVEQKLVPSNVIKEFHLFE